jgi:hypothetical protein
MGYAKARREASHENPKKRKPQETRGKEKESQTTTRSSLSGIGASSPFGFSSFRGFVILYACIALMSV